MKKIGLASAIALAISANVSAYQIILNGTVVYDDTTAVNSVSVQQTGSQLVLRTDPPVTINTGSNDGGGDATPVAPQFTSSASQSAAENQLSVATITATDANGDSVTFSVSGGTDASHFEFSGSALRFKQAKDFEQPDDANSDGSYLVELTASDGSLTSTQSMTVTLTDVNEDGGGAGACGNPPSGAVVSNGFSLSSPGPEVVLALTSSATISMPFTTLSSTNTSGRFSFANTSGTATVTREMWISECPTATVPSGTLYGCKVTGNTSGTINWSESPGSDWRKCNLDPNKQYYLNVRNTNCSGSVCSIKRNIFVNY